MHADRLVAKRMLAGDEAAFRAFFDTHFPKLYRFALARLDGQHDEAKDVVQQSFVKAFQSLDSYRGEASIYSWMCQICRNTIIDLERRRHRERRHMPLLEDDTGIQGILDTLSAPVATQPEQETTRADLARLIQATLDALPGHYGDVLEWKYIDGLSTKEIAERLAVGPKAAESMLTRARKAFRDAVDSIGNYAELIPAAQENS